MLKYFIVFATLILFTFSSCKKIKDLLTFTIHDATEFTVPSATGINIPIALGTSDVASSSKQTFSNNNTNADLVKDIKLKKLTLTITNPSSKTFSFLKSIHIYISADNAPEILLASREGITNDIGSTLELITTNEKLDAYVSQSNYSLRTDIVTDETILTDITIQANMTYTVMADPL